MQAPVRITVGFSFSLAELCVVVPVVIADEFSVLLKRSQTVWSTSQILKSPASSLPHGNVL